MLGKTRGGRRCRSTVPCVRETLTPPLFGMTGRRGASEHFRKPDVFGRQIAALCGSAVPFNRIDSLHYTLPVPAIQVKK